MFSQKGNGTEEPEESVLLGRDLSAYLRLSAVYGVARPDVWRKILNCRLLVTTFSTNDKPKDVRPCAEFEHFVTSKAC